MPQGGGYVLAVSALVQRNLPRTSSVAARPSTVVHGRADGLGGGELGWDHVPCIHKLLRRLYHQFALLSLLTRR